MFGNVRLVLPVIGYEMASEEPEGLDLTNNGVIRINLERSHDKR